LENKKSADVSFIIIEYHSLNDVLKCVDSIRENFNDLSYEVIISSNSQYDSSKQDLLKQAYPNIKWSFNEKNNGFAFGMNCGISISEGKFIILQNPDTSVQNNALRQALNLLDQDKSIGLIGPKILNEKQEIQDSCRDFVTPMMILSRSFKRLLFNKGSILDNQFDYNKIQNVNWVIGAYMIISREALEKVGFLNEQFFMYVEDMDWCLRFWEKKLKVVYYPELVIKYEGDRKSTKGKFLNKYTFIHLKNYLIFIRNHGLRKIREFKKNSV
jgi:N-acetylglucosaminyl-diphospho-decaprenol L-rhamnosyltransferase